MNKNGSYDLLQTIDSQYTRIVWVPAKGLADRRNERTVFLCESYLCIQGPHRREIWRTQHLPTEVSKGKDGPTGILTKDCIQGTRREGIHQKLTSEVLVPGIQTLSVNVAICVCCVSPGKVGHTKHALSVSCRQLTTSATASAQIFQTEAMCLSTGLVALD